MDSLSLSRQLFKFSLICSCEFNFLMGSMNYSNYLMACTVFAQTLTTRCCCVRSSEGVNLSATSGYARQSPSLRLPSFLPSTSVTLVTLANQPHYCHHAVWWCWWCRTYACLLFFTKNCMSSVLACCTCVKSWHNLKKKSMLKRDWTELWIMGRRLCWLQGCGTFADGNH